MVGRVFLDKNERLWAEIELDGENYLEDSRDISEEHNLPKMMLLESGDSEFLSIYHSVNKADKMKKVGSCYTMIRVGDGNGYFWAYTNVPHLKKFLFEKLKKCVSLKDYYSFSLKYDSLLRALYNRSN